MLAEGRILKDMGERVYKQRKMCGLTQEELAEAIGVSPQMISNLELGKKAIRPENLINLCAALKVSADYILTGDSRSGERAAVSEKIFELSHEEFEIVKQLVEYFAKQNGSV